MADRIDKTMVRIEADQQAAKKLIAQIGQVRAAMTATAAAVKDTGTGAGRVERAFADYGKSAQTAGRRIDQLNEGIDQLRRETMDAVDAQERLDRAMRSVGGSAQAQAVSVRAARESAMLYGDVESRTRAITGAVGYLGGAAGAGVERTINVGAEVLAAVEGVKLLRLELPHLTEQMGLANVSTARLGVGVGVAAAATAALAIGVDALRDSSERAREAVQAQIEFERRRADISPAQRTRAELQAEVAELDKVSAARAEQIERLEAERAALFDSYNALEQLAEATGVHNQGLDDYDDRLRELRIAQDADLKLKDELEDALRRNVTAQADALAWEEAAADRRKIAAQEASQAIDRQIQRELDLRRQIASATPEQVSSQAQALKDEIAAINAALDDLDAQRGGGVMTLAEIQIKERELLERRRQAAADLSALNTVVASAAARRQTAADAEKRLEQATRDAAQATERATDAEAKRASLLDSYADATEQIAYKRRVDDTREAEDFARKQAADRAKHNADLIALDRKHLEARAELVAKVAESSVGADKEQIDALRDFQKDEARATVRYWQDIRRINRDERLSVASAAARLDASAVWEAQQSAKQQREERTEQLELERKERAEDYKDRLDELAEQRDEKKRAAEQELRDLDDKHRQERQARIAAFNQQLAEEAADRRIRQQRLAQDRAYEDTLRQQQFNNELAAINSLIVAAEQLERQSRATILAGGANPVQTGGGGGGLSGTQQYYQQIAQSAATGRYVSWSGQRVRTDMYDPMQAAGMTAGEWHDWKRRYGLQRGGMATPGRDYLVGEQGPEWVRFMQPARVYPHGVTPGSIDNSRVTGDVNVTVNEAQTPQATAAIVCQAITELIG